MQKNHQSDNNYNGPIDDDDNDGYCRLLRFVCVFNRLATFPPNLASPNLGILNLHSGDHIMIQYLYTPSIEIDFQVVGGSKCFLFWPKK